MLNFFLLYKYTITNFELRQLFLSYFVMMADQFSGLDTRANHTRKIVHTWDLQLVCCFAHEKDWMSVLMSVIVCGAWDNTGVLCSMQIRTASRTLKLTSKHYVLNNLSASLYYIDYYYIVNLFFILSIALENFVIIFRIVIIN